MKITQWGLASRHLQTWWRNHKGTNHMIWSHVFHRKWMLWQVCGCLYMNLTGKWKKNFRTVYSLFGHWNTTFNKIGLLSVLKMAACSLRFVPATKCCCIKVKAAKNFRHCYLGLSKLCWTIFLVSSPRSFPFSYIFLHNGLKQLCWICLMALGGSNTTWIFDCLNCSCIKWLYCCLDELLHLPTQPRQSQIRKLFEEITVGSGGPPRFGAYAGGGIILSSTFVLDFSIIGVVFWKPKFVVASWS